MEKNKQHKREKEINQPRKQTTKEEKRHRRKVAVRSTKRASVWDPDERKKGGG